jgi:hypothetical protein
MAHGLKLAHLGQERAGGAAQILGQRGALPDFLRPLINGRPARARVFKDQVFSHSGQFKFP